jgi:hypothetical protein
MGHREHVLKRLAAFKGVLRKPIRPLGLNALIGVRERDRLETKALSDAFEERVKALFAHYEIGNPDAPGAGIQLALRLASDFVPGFRLELAPRKKRGRPVKWTPEACFELLRSVELECAKRDISGLEACRQLTRRGRPYAGARAESLYRIYHQALPARHIWERMYARKLNPEN